MTAAIPDEQALIAELHDLIRYIYTPKLAEEMIETFAGALKSKKTLGERLGVIQHWTELYKLEKYRRQQQRRRPSFKERTKACSACGYPASHRHHLWDIATHGENEVTVNLCANCHELHHLIYNVLAKDSDYSRNLLLHMLMSNRIAYIAVERLLGWCLATMRYEIKNGWLEPYKVADEWIERQLGWNEYQRKAQGLV